jgi:ribosomal protein S6
MKYEVMIVVRPDIGEEDRNAIKENLQKELEKENGSLINWAVWAEKRKLAYTLKTRGAKKIRFNEAAYILADIDIPASRIARIRYTLRLNENIFRALIIKKGAENG